MAKRPAAPKKKPHDMGGDPAGPVDQHEHTPTMTERRIDAMMLLLRQKPRAFWVTDENRRTIESLSPDTYRDTHYYEKWCLSLRNLLIEKEVLTEAEIEAKLAEVKARYGRGAKIETATAKAAKVAGKAPSTVAKAVPAARQATAAKTTAAPAKSKTRAPR